MVFADEIAPTCTAYWFYGFQSLKTITGLDKLNTANVKDMNNMFASCRALTEGGEPEVLAGGGESGFRDGPAASARFAAPRGIAAGKDGTLYIADTANGALRRLRDGRVDTLLAPATDGETGPAAPAGLLLRGDTLYICDRFARRVYLVSLGAG